MELGTWNIDPARSRIEFSARHMVVTKVRGRFTRFSGTIAGAEGDPLLAATQVEIEAASIDTGQKDRDDELRSAGFLNVERFPVLMFKSTRVLKDRGDRYRVFGDLTIRDATREVVLEVSPSRSQGDASSAERKTFRATSVLERARFGLVWNAVIEAGGMLVSDRIDVEIEVQAVRA